MFQTEIQARDWAHLLSKERRACLEEKTFEWLYSKLSKTIPMKCTFFMCSVILEKKFSSLNLWTCCRICQCWLMTTFSLGAKWGESSSNKLFWFLSDFFWCFFIKVSQSFPSCLAFQYSCSLGFTLFSARFLLSRCIGPLQSHSYSSLNESMTSKSYHPVCNFYQASSRFL